MDFSKCPTEPPGGGAWTLGLSESPTDPPGGGGWTLDFKKERIHILGGGVLQSDARISPVCEQFYTTWCTFYLQNRQTHTVDSSLATTEQCICTESLTLSRCAQHDSYLPGVLMYRSIPRYCDVGRTQCCPLSFARTDSLAARVTREGTRETTPWVTRFTRRWRTLPLPPHLGVRVTQQLEALGQRLLP